MAFFAISTFGAVAWFKCKLGPQLNREVAAKEAAALASNIAKEQAAAAERTHQDQYIRSAMLALASGNQTPVPQEARTSTRKRKEDGVRSKLTKAEAEKATAPVGVIVGRPQSTVIDSGEVDPGVLAQREREQVYIRRHMLRVARGEV